MDEIESVAAGIRAVCNIDVAGLEVHINFARFARLEKSNRLLEDGLVQSFSVLALAATHAANATRIGLVKLDGRILEGFQHDGGLY